MGINFISELRLGLCSNTLCVRVSRIWEFRGKNEEDPVKHLDLVLIDEKGDSIYAEVPAHLIPQVQPLLHEGQIIYMRKITVDRAKQIFRAVQNPYMIRLNDYTEIGDVTDPQPDFPKYTFSLTPIAHLNQYTGKQDTFLDVIGKITAISNAATVQTSSGSIKFKRIIHLQDQNENMVELSLWGSRAQEFDGDAVYEVGQNHHVIAIFVGTSMKQYRGSPSFLSGTAACRWYINENDVTEIKDFYKSLPVQTQPIKKLYLHNHEEMQKQIEFKSLLELSKIDPFDHMGTRFECTVVIIDLAPNQSWCYPACTACNSTSAFNGTQYQCTKDACACTTMEYRYKLCVIGSDTTWQLQFMIFQERAIQLIGKPAEKLLTRYKKSEIPAEILALKGQKFTFIVRVLQQKKIKINHPTFEVLSIKQIFGKQSCIPKVEDTTTSSSSTLENDNLPPLVPICSRSLQNKFSPADTQQNDDIQYMEIEQTGISDDKNSCKVTCFDNKEQLQSNDDNNDHTQRTKRSRT